MTEKNPICFYTKNRLTCLSRLGIDTEFHVYPGLGHGFGLGTGTAAEGWIYDATAFWERQMPESARMQNRQKGKSDRKFFGRRT